MDSQTQQFVARWAILGPLILESLAIVALAVIVVTHDGESTQQVTNALLALIGANVLAGGSVAVVHAIKAAPTPAPAVASAPPQVIALPAQASVVIPAPAVAPAPAPAPVPQGPAPVATGL